ncbi:CYTH domain-containing protein [bacterium LRH843]|nr:CYTH domain-containing protein [bacterium LRH843]
MQEVEFEEKSMLSEQSYLNLLNGFKTNESDAVIQHNDYFETLSFDLKHSRSALRIRTIGQAYTLTLKQPHDKGILETHQAITEKEWSHATKANIIPFGDVYRQLQSLCIPIDKLIYLGRLTTKRIELPYKNGTLCLDKSLYFDQIDYEVEFEGTDEVHARTTLLTLLTDYNITPKHADNKVKRFFKRKKELNTDR